MNKEELRKKLIEFAKANNSEKFDQIFGSGNKYYFIGYREDKDILYTLDGEYKVTDIVFTSRAIAAKAIETFGEEEIKKLFT